MSHRLRAKIIDGKLMAKTLKDEVHSEVNKWVAAGHRKPNLTAILVGNDPASATYVRNKMKAAEYTGLLQTCYNGLNAFLVMNSKLQFSVVSDVVVCRGNISSCSYYVISVVLFFRNIFII